MPLIVDIVIGSIGSPRDKNLICAESLREVGVFEGHAPSRFMFENTGIRDHRTVINAISMIHCSNFATPNAIKHVKRTQQIKYMRI